MAALPLQKRLAALQLVLLSLPRVPLLSGVSPCPGLEAPSGVSPCPGLEAPGGVSPCPGRGKRLRVTLLAPGPGPTPQWRLSLPQARASEWRESESQARA